MSRDAFTLLEIILVIAIIAICSLTISIAVSPIENFENSTAVKGIVRDIIHTRNAAISANQKTRINFSEDYYESELLKEPITLPEDMSIEYHNTDYFEFTSNGSPSMSGRIYIKVGRKYQTITVEPVTGRVNLKDGKK